MIEDLYTDTAAIQGKVRTPDNFGGWTEVWANLIASLPGHFYALSGAERARYAKKELFASYAFMCSPQVMDGQVREYNDQSAQLNTWVFTGLAKGTNTDAAGKLYIKLVDAAGTRTVSVYKDSVLGGGDLVAQGSRAGDGAVVLAAQGGSGLSGTVNVVWTVNDSDIYLQFPFRIAEDDRFVLEGKNYKIVFVNTSIPKAKYWKLLLEDIE